MPSIKPERHYAKRRLKADSGKLTVQGIKAMPTNREILLCRYHYDPLDRLAACSLSEQASTQRFYQKSRLVTEIQGSMQRSVFQQDDQLLAQQQHQGGTVETTLLATDQQRSVLTALNATQPHPLAYTPYGHRAPENGLLSLLGFNGERPDPVTGHYLLGNGYRAFNPVLMRFNSPDSWSPFGEGGVNAYAYCLGNPINFRDPTGHSLSSILATITSTARSATPKSWRIVPKHLPPSAIIENMDKGLLESINRYQPTTKRILTSADNAVNHAKLIGYRGKEIESLIKAKRKLSTYSSSEQKTIKRLQSEISYDSNSDGPTLVESAQARYSEELEHQSLLTLQKTFDLNKKLVETLGETATTIRIGHSNLH
jgi:RHS repeat-associated protein